MGQKVNPHGLRVGVIKDWDSRWYAREDKVGDLIVEDYNIRKYLKNKLYAAGVAKIEIERSNGKVKINLWCSRPGVVIGKAGAEIENLRKEVDALIVIPNDRLLELSDRTIGIVDAFKTADTALLAGVQGITDLITSNSYIHVDFNDVNAILRGAGTALFGIGSARGEDRATQAAEIAISSPLLEESIEGAHGALINIAGPTDLKLQEAAAAVALVQKAIHPEAQIIWGLSLDDAYGDEVRVTVIAAGFDANSKKPDQPAEEKPAAAKENTVPLSALSAGVQAPAQQPQPVQTPAVPQVQPLSSYIPSTPDQNVASFDQTTEHEVVSANDPGDLDIPDFLR